MVVVVSLVWWAASTARRNRRRPPMPDGGRPRRVMQVAVVAGLAAAGLYALVAAVTLPLSTAVFQVLTAGVLLGAAGVVVGAVARPALGAASVELAVDVEPPPGAHGEARPFPHRWWDV